ncbi:MAG: GGDEF domain-containing protein [Ruminiclostridium sp.]|nr:GGDEF domain-containing protein [Ruminiclostridium sp.]
MIQDIFLQSIVQINCIPVLTIIFLFHFLRTNRAYEMELTKKFIPSVLLLFALIIVDNLDYYAYDTMVVTGIFDTFHRLSAMLGYDIRIILMASLISIAANRTFENRKAAFYTYLPSVVNVAVLIPCLFTDIFFYYNTDGTIGRGPLAFEPHILSGFYILFLFYLALRCRSESKYSEASIIGLCGIMTILGFLAEFLFALRGILIGVIALDITFYYLYLHIEHFRFDALTDVFNRVAFMADIDKYGRGTISHILSIDLNDLKVINDTYGHNEGDKALKATARALKKASLPKCFIYRVGGDEFAAVCINKSTPEIETMIAEMQEAVSDAGYACAIGFAEWKEGKSFTEVYKEADDMMYAKKREMKNFDAAVKRLNRISHVSGEE